MSFMQLRLAIERAIRADENIGTDPIKIAIVGGKNDREIIVLMKNSLFSTKLKEHFPNELCCRSSYGGCDGFQGSLKGLENAFNELWLSRGAVYHLDGSNISLIQFGVFSPLEIQQFIRCSSSSSSTLPGYSSASNKANNPFDVIPTERFNYTITDLNSILISLESYMIVRPPQPDIKVSFFPDLSGAIRPTAVVQLRSDRDMNSVCRGEFSCSSFAEYLAVDKFGLTMPDDRRSIKTDRQYTIKEGDKSPQHVYLKIDASDVSMSELRSRLLAFTLPKPLELRSDFVSITSQEYCLPHPPGNICWNLRFTHQELQCVENLLSFLEKVGFKNVTSDILEEKAKKAPSFYSSDVSGLPLNPFEFTVRLPTPIPHSTGMEQIIHINSSPESFTAIVSMLRKLQAPKQNVSLTL